MATKKVTQMDVDLVSVVDGKSVVTDKTDVVCWWDTEPFEGPPCFLPHRVNDGTYYVSGCFCSDDCAAAYNLELNDYKVWERMSLLKCLRNDIEQATKVSSKDVGEERCGEPNQIRIAYPRYTLKKFGGNLSTEEFRKDCIRNHEEYRLVMPPMVPVVPYIEKNYKKDSVWNTFKTAEESNLVLKRTKPLPNTNTTLVQTMGLVFKNKK